MNAWSIPVDLYCERTDPSFWAEPFNAVSNVGFLVAAAAAHLRLRAQGRPDWPAFALVLAAAAVGVGSFGFHTLATRGAALLDVVPIAVFIYGYLLLALRRFLRLRMWAAAPILVIFAAASRLFEGAFPPGFLNGPISYVPALLAMAAVGALAPRKAQRAVLAAALFFAVSLVLRSVDLAVCPTIPLGTHFLWHGLNALVIFILLRAAIDARRVPEGAAPGP